MYKAIESTRLCENSDSDDRAYLKVKIGKDFIIGLVDSGANITCLGKDALKFLEANSLTYTPIKGSLKTADGEQKPLLGYLKTTISYRKQCANFTIFIAPDLSQSLYLGTDFIRYYQLAPLLFPMLVSEISQPDPNKHLLTTLQEQQLAEVTSLFPSSEVLGLGKTHLEFHTIDTNDHLPIKSRHYPVSPAIQELIDKEVDRMLSLGVIEPSESPWASPVTLVRKPNKNRLCLDFRKVNEVSVKLAYPIPNIEGIISRLSKTKYITALDLKDAYWQIPLDLKSREKTAFVVPGRPLYHFTVMPFGLCNAAQRMMMLMDKVIPNELKETVFVYLDDLLVVSTTFEEHLDKLRIVAQKIQAAGLTINIRKSNFCFRQLNYLGYVVGEGCLKTDPNKTAAISDFPLPKTKRQMRGFLGLAGWYRRFISDFASVAAPLTDALKGESFQITDLALKAFNHLKQLLTNSPILSQPDFEKEFFVQTDASNVGIGSVLFQKDHEGNEKPIYFYSAKLSAAEKNYSVTERECLSVIKAVKKFRPYIEGYKFTIITDHHSLKWLMTTKDLNGRLARWSLKLQPFTFDIEHRKGALNIVPDSLSRQFCLDALYIEESDFSNCCPFILDFKDPSFESAEYLDLVSYVLENSEQLPDVTSSEGFVYKRMNHAVGDELLDTNIWKLWIPSALRNDLIKSAHDPPNRAHGGIGKTIHRLKERFYWPYMALDVRTYIKVCEKCQSSKAPNYTLKPPMEGCFIVDRPFQHLFLDFLGPYPRTRNGNTKMLIVVDQLTKFILLEPVKSSMHPLLVNYLQDRVFSIFGTPESILADNGPEFKSKKFEEFLEVRGVRCLSTAKYSPQGNSSERVNRSIVEAIRCYIKEHSTWDQNISDIACALRSAVHQTLQTTPYEALFGQTMVQNGKDY